MTVVEPGSKADWGALRLDFDRRPPPQSPSSAITSDALDSAPVVAIGTIHCARNGLKPEPELCRGEGYLRQPHRLRVVPRPALALMSDAAIRGASDDREVCLQSSAPTSSTRMVAGRPYCCRLNQSPISEGIRAPATPTHCALFDISGQRRSHNRRIFTSQLIRTLEIGLHDE